MLARRNRLRGRDILDVTIRSGQRIKGQSVVFHAHRTNDLSDDHPPQLAFAVSKRIGNSVERHRVARRLRHISVDFLDGLPSGTHVVVRALPGAARASNDQMARDFERLVKRIG